MFFVIAGLLYITGPVFNVSYQQVRLIIPRLVAALVFGTISLYLLELSVEFTNALTHAFKPAQLALEFEQAMGLSLALIIVVVFKAVLLLAVVLMYSMRGYTGPEPGSGVTGHRYLRSVPEDEEVR
jgi:hypothetical protein